MIEIKNYTKKIKKRIVLDHINCKFENKMIYGLYGVNGSGKTMLLRAIAGLIKPTEGDVLIDGKMLHRDISFPDSVGLIIENMEMLPYLSAADNLKLLADIKKIAKDDDIINAIERVGLPVNNDKVKTFSLGMRQKLNIAQAIFEKPQILLLDEPTNALDEKSVHMIHNVIKEEKERGAAILIATHNKYDINDLCDEVFQMVDGRLEESSWN
ncbi:MAG: ABC transporter ATP-binding protein [Dorea sp.]|nr:ABC transporter ATP-binding protein [Dorea sp.]